MSAGKCIRVAVTGYGVIGKKVADAMAMQDDMQVADAALGIGGWRW